MNETFGEYIKRKSIEKRKLPTNPTLSHSNSDTKLIIIKLNEKREKNKKNEKYFQKKNHEKCSSCNICHHIKKMIKKDKRRLSDYIINNEKYVKLFGNSRYTNKPPSLFVKDEKKKINQKNFGLIPLPLKPKKKIKNKEDHQKLYDLQRSIVMIRRFQYHQKVKVNNNNIKDYFSPKKMNINDIVKIQKWWKKIFKVIKIQKYFRGYFMRKEILAVKKLFCLMNKFENFLLKLKGRKSFLKIIQFVSIKKPIYNIQEGYFQKNDLIINKNIIDNIILIQSLFRKFLSKKKRNFMSNKKFKFIPYNKNFFMSKKSYNKILLDKKIELIQKKIREYLKNKKPIIKKKIDPYILNKKIVSRPNPEAKRIQKWFKRNYEFLCNEKNKSGFFPKENKWEFYTKTKIDENSINNLFIQRKKNYDNYNEMLEEKGLRSNKIIYPFTSINCYISKLRRIDLINKIEKIQNFTKKKVIKYNRNISPVFGSYSYKIYLSIKNQNIINFIHLIKHGMIIKNMKKIIKYKPINNYNNDDINKIISIQKFYKNHYYSQRKNIKKVYKFYNQKGYFSDKIRRKNNCDEIKFLQNSFKNYLINLEKKKDVIDKTNLNKYFSSPLNYINNFESNKEGSNICFITKKYITNVSDKLKSIQSKVTSFILVKKLKKEYNNSSKYPLINKINLNENQLYTKIIFRLEDSINKIKLIQNFYKERYNYFNENILPNNFEESLKTYSEKNKIINNNSLKKYNSKNDTSKMKLNNEKLINNYKTSNKLNENQILTLFDNLKRNKKPVPNINNNYISKKRIELIAGKTYLSDYNIPTQIPCLSLCLLGKNRLINNIEFIKKIQFHFRNYKKRIENIIKKPSKHELMFSELNDNNEEDKFYIFNNNKSKKSRNEKKMNNKFDSENIKINYHNYGYITKIRLRDSNKQIKKIQNVFKSFSSFTSQDKVNIENNKIFKENKLKPISNCYISKIRINKDIRKKYIENVHYNIKIIKKPNFNNENNINKEDLDNEKKTLSNKSINYISKVRYNNNSVLILRIQNYFKKINSFHKNLTNPNEHFQFKLNISSIGNITKIRKNNSNKEMGKIIMIQNNIKLYLLKQKKEKEIKNKQITITHKLIPSQLFISKITLLNNEKEIKKIQNKFISMIANKRQESFNTISRFSIKKSKTKNIILENNNENFNDLDNQIIRKNDKKDKSLSYNLENNFIDNNYLYYSLHSFPEFSGFISKIYKINIYKINKQLNSNSYFTKKIYKTKSLPPNLDFINLLKLYITKKTQELIFYKLKYNSFLQIENSFYIKTLQRNINFYLSNPKEGKKVKIFLEKVFPELKTEKSKTIINKILSNLTLSQQKQLQNNNIYTSIEEDFINYLNLFSKYDKKLSNENFIRERLKQSNLTNTNIFTLTKFIDDEYDNLVNGKYCIKCYQKRENCHCTKKSTDDEEDYIDIEIPNDELSLKTMINHFEYDSTKCKGVLIKRKPKIEESYEDPITNMIVDKKKLNKNYIQKIESDSNNSSNNSLKGNKGLKNNNLTNKSIAELKALYHNDNNKNKSNQVLIRDSNFNENDENF